MYAVPEGLTHVDGDDRRRIVQSVVMIVTERRVVFVADDGRNGDAGSLAYADLTRVRTEATTVVLTTADEICCEFRLPDDAPDVDAVLSHLRWIGTLRSQFVACKNDVDLAIGEIRDHASAMEWGKAEMKYVNVRRTLDDLIVALQWTEPVPNDAITPGIAEVERRLERAVGQTLVERAESELELAQQLVENGDFDRVGSVLCDATEYHERARSHAEAAERPNGFRFGEQRELREDLDDLSRSIEAVTEAPLRRARAANERADAAGNLSATVEHLETALCRYREALDMDPDIDDHADLGREMESVADDLVASRRELARVGWNAGADRKRTGATKEAIRQWSEAIDHLKRAVELAAEFDHEDAGEIEDRLDRLRRTLTAMRDTAAPSGDTSDVAEDPTADASDAAEDPTADDLPQIREPSDTASDTVSGTAVEKQATDGGHSTVERFEDGDSSARPEAGDTEENREETTAEELHNLTKAILQSDPDEE